MIKSFQIVIFFLFYGISVLTAQPKSKWLSQNINNEDGLSNSAVTRIFLDSKGVMWFGTWDGLNMYNGTNIRVFKPDISDKSSISNNIIRDLFEDNQGNFWIVTDQGINRFLSNKMNFQSYFSDNKNLPVKEHNLKACIGPDSLVFISIYGYGIAYYNNNEDDFVRLKLPDLTEKDEKEIIGIYGQPGRNMYLLTEGGMLYAYREDKGYKKIYEIEIAQNTELDLMKHWFVKANNSDYIVVGLKKGGILMCNLTTHNRIYLMEGQQQIRLTTVNEAIDSNILWIGTDEGSIFKIDFESKPMVERMDSYFLNYSSNKVKIWTIEQPTEDLLWIGTDGNGVYRYITKGKPFYNIKKGSKQSGSLSHNIVRAIIKDEKENLWVGTRGGGLNMIPNDGGETQYFNTENGLSNNAVISLNIDRQNNLWIGIDGEGIDMLETKSGRIFHFPEDFSNVTNLDFGRVYSICIDVYNHIWLGTSGYGVIDLEISKKANGNYYLNNYKQFISSSGENGLQSNIVYSIIEERPNVLWIGTRGGGVHRLNTLNNSFEVFGKADKSENGLSNDDILSLCMGLNEQLWIGTSGGINKLNLAYKPYQFQHFTEHNGLPNNTVHGILEGADSNIWLSTNRGLSKFIVSENRFINFNKTDGLQCNEYTDGAVYNDTLNNWLYFGGVEGVDWFNPQQIKSADHFPPIIFDEFRLYNTQVVPGDSTLILTKSLDKTDKIELRYNQNFFSFSFSTLNYYNSQKCKFAYYLEGFDPDWNYIQTDRTSNFTNVPPGTYTFKIKATNEDGIFGDEVREMTIIIHPPIWNTIYAYILYFILFVLLIFFIITYFKKRTRQKRQIEIEKIHQQKKDEINQYKLQFFTNIAHEFRTPLTLILAPAVTLMNYVKKDKNLGVYAQSIYENANRLQRLIQELIEFRKVETGNMKLEIRKCELVNYVSEIVRAFDQFAKQNEISLNFIHKQTSIESWIDIKKLEKVLLNLISNAIKYTPKGGSVSVEIEMNEDNVLFSVRDTGIGIPADLREKIFDRFFHGSTLLPQLNTSQEGAGVGLALTKSLVELHKGKITVDSVAGGGSLFKVILPSKEEIYNQDIVKDAFVIKTEKIAKKVYEEFQIPHDYPSDESVKILTKENKAYTILIVDDNSQVCNLISSLLVDEYFLFTAHNGDEALAILDVERIDLVISDVIMPKMDGLELCSIIKSDINTSHIPVILLTAKGELEQRIEGIEAGADSYIPKPFHPKHLKVRIEKLLETMDRFRKSFKEYDPQPQSELLQGLSSKDRKLITNLTNYIEERLEDSSLNAESLSSHQAMSKTQLYRKIKILTDLTPHGLIKHIRLKKAAHLLREGEKTVSEVFYETGFNNRTYFYRSFKDAYGVTPGEYIKTNKKNNR